MEYFTTGTLGSSQSFTPEGFLICRDTPIGRLGTQLYAETEILGDDGEPLIEAVDGVVRVNRVAEEVFNPVSMATARGKPVVNDHPQGENGELLDVTPDNWRDLAIGSVLDLRRGVGVEDDVLLADLQITDAKAIQLVREGKRQLSIGYNCDYYQTAPGRAEQRNIVVNHVALVEQGRCGPRCAIGDSAAGVKTMAAKNWLTKLLLRAHMADSAEEVAALAKEAPAEALAGEKPGGSGHETHLHIHNGPKPRDNERGGEDDREDKREVSEGREGREERQRGADRTRSLRDRLRGGRDRTRGRDDEGGETDAISERFEALEEQHQDQDARLSEIEDMLVELLGDEGGEGEEGGMRDARRGQVGLRDRIRDRRRDKSRGRDANEADPDKERPIEGDLEEEAPEGTGDRARRARDSAYLAPAFRETVAMAEIIAPGIELPTFDVNRKPVRTFDDICGLRKRAVIAAYATADGRALITDFLGRGRAFDARTLQCKQALSIFSHLGAVKKATNTRDAAGPGSLPASSVGAVPVGGSVKSVDDLNELFNKHYASVRA